MSAGALFLAGMGTVAYLLGGVGTLALFVAGLQDTDE